MHPRNRHQGQYDFNLLVKVLPELGKFVIQRFGRDTLDFADTASVRALNKALLKASYQINFWDIPEEFLCPPIPGRADYIHALADLIGERKGSAIRVLDIGTGASLIYPLIGQAEYGWSFIGTDINSTALANARKIIDKNNLTSKIELRKSTSGNIFTTVFEKNEHFTLTMCNPPFHASPEEAISGTERKWRNLKIGKTGPHRNFGGTANELWHEGGEKAFVGQMIEESSQFQKQVEWFTTLVSKDENLKVFERILRKFSPRELKVIPMSQGSKNSRVLAWHF